MDSVDEVGAVVFVIIWLALIGQERMNKRNRMRFKFELRRLARARDQALLPDENSLGTQTGLLN